MVGNIHAELSGLVVLRSAQTSDRNVPSDRRRFIQLAGCSSFSGAVVPEPRASLPMCYGKDDNVQVVCPEDEVERKSTKNRSPEVGIET